MPPNTRKAPRRGAERGESSSAALEDGVGDGNVEDWNNAARDAARTRRRRRVLQEDQFQNFRRDTFRDLDAI